MMAQWRTAFNMTQDEVAGLADKINYLGNTGPANAKKISDIVTRIGPLGGVAGVASGEIAAMGQPLPGWAWSQKLPPQDQELHAFPDRGKFSDKIAETGITFSADQSEEISC